jgi:hypothetical protein
MRKVCSLLFGFIMLSEAHSQNNCLQFNGTCDVSLASPTAFDFSINDAFTIETWFRTSANTAVIFSNHVDVSPYVGYEFSIVQGKAVLELINDHLTNAMRVESVTSYNDGNWHHFAAVYPGITAAASTSLYVDGIYQSVNATSNSLSAPINTGNPPHIGSRNGTSYSFVGSLDELRVWKRALCGAEIVARKNCHLTGNEAGLLAYYKFNQGAASGSNAGVTTATDSGPFGHNGTLVGFQLTGNSSNWIQSTASVSGTCGAAVPVGVSGPSVICKGALASLTGTGAATYSWSTGQATTNIVVSPTVTTAYSFTAATASDCREVYTHTVSVVVCIGLADHNSSRSRYSVPNPADHQVTVEAEAGELFVLSDFSGRVVRTLILTEGKNKIDLNDVVSGVYLVRVGTSAGKVIIRH